jgi:glutamine phosphoribosylpyrophosphate amidotransferase
VDPILIAKRIAERLGATSLCFGALEDLSNALGRSTSDFCAACFTNAYDKIPGGRLYDLVAESGEGRESVV